LVDWSEARFGTFVVPNAPLRSLFSKWAGVAGEVGRPTIGWPLRAAEGRSAHPATPLPAPGTGPTSATQCIYANLDGMLMFVF